MSDPMLVYMIHVEYSDPRLFLHLSDARQYVEDLAQANFDYMQQHPERYPIISAFFGAWDEVAPLAGTVARYTYGEERQRTITGEWADYWGRYSIYKHEVQTEYMPRSESGGQWHI